MQSSQTVTIGRNVNGVPMPEDRWKQLMQDFRALFNETHFAICGVGASDDWGFEDVFVIGGQTELEPYVFLNLGHMYDQEAIAIGIGLLVDTTRTYTSDEDWANE